MEPKPRRQNVQRKSFAVSKKNVEWITDEAKRLGISDSEVVRRALDAAQERQEQQRKAS